MMKHQTFFIQLGVLTLVLAMLLFGIRSFFDFPFLDSLFGVSSLFFILFNIILFFLAKKVATSEDKYAFSRLALGAMVLKMFLLVAVILTYDQIVQPKSKYFIFIFILIYIPYTIFETHIMMRLSKEKA